MPEAMFEKREPYVRFYVEQVQDMKATADEGRPIFKAVEMVQVIQPGDAKSDHRAPAHEKAFLNPDRNVGGALSYAERFPKHYAAFRENRTLAEEGTPIEQAVFLTEEQKAAFKFMKIITVEALAGLPDSGLANLGPYGRQYREQAQAYLKHARDGSWADVAAENADLRSKFEAMAAELEKLKRGRKEVAA